MVSMGAYRFRLGKIVVDPGDAPHAFQVLLGLDGDGAQGASDLPSCHGHLDTGLRSWTVQSTLWPACHPMPLSKDTVGLSFGRLFCMDTGGWHCESRRLWQKWCSGQGCHVWGEGEDRRMQHLQRLLPQLVERCGAHLAAADTGFMAPRCLELLKQKSCIFRVLQWQKDRILTSCTICPYTHLMHVTCSFIIISHWLFERISCVWFTFSMCVSGPPIMWSLVALWDTHSLDLTTSFLFV